MTELIEQLQKICGASNVSTNDASILEYVMDLSCISGQAPVAVVTPTNSSQVERIVKLANELDFKIVPVSSPSGPRAHGDTIPQADNSIILDLSKMNKILRIDSTNREIMVEPGVTFSQIIPEVKKAGLRLLMPLNPRGSKSVLASALEREPPVIPRYQWDSSDPLLCTEVIFGTGDQFRTGAAAGPGSIEEQMERGGLQKNPLGPTQFSPYRIIQGAQGSIGIVTWATIKVEFQPSIQKILYLATEDLSEILELQHQLVKYRLCDELIILNSLNFAVLMETDPNKIIELAKNLQKWILIIVLSGRGKVAKDKLEYLEGEIGDIVKNLGITLVEELPNVDNSKVLDALTNCTEKPWRLRLTEGCQDIFFIAPHEKISKFVKMIEKYDEFRWGIYIQPIVQGTSFHVEFDMYYDPKNGDEVKKAKETFMTISKELMDAGAFFNRPYGLWADEAFKHHAPETADALRKIKKIFDPKGVLKPGVLCFK
ncbi:MAG: FAD-binding oxidoreductase [Candidatus Helarchaeales archaeon]